MATSTIQTQTPTEPRLAIKKEHLAGLDPEWVELWHRHGAHMVRADELSLEEYRENPAQYSFTYPTCAGQFCRPFVPKKHIHQRQALMSFMSKTSKCR